SQSGEWTRWHDRRLQRARALRTVRELPGKLNEALHEVGLQRATIGEADRLFNLRGTSKANDCAGHVRMTDRKANRRFLASHRWWQNLAQLLGARPIAFKQC